MRLLYEQAAREQRELAERVRAHGNGDLAADFERWASDLERLAHPSPVSGPRPDSTRLTSSRMALIGSKSAMAILV
jgi:hypothetical protein